MINTGPGADGEHPARLPWLPCFPLREDSQVCSSSGGISQNERGARTLRSGGPGLCAGQSSTVIQQSPTGRGKWVCRQTGSQEHKEYYQEALQRGAHSPPQGSPAGEGGGAHRPPQGSPAGENNKGGGGKGSTTVGYEGQHREPCRGAQRT